MGTNIKVQLGKLKVVVSATKKKLNKLLEWMYTLKP